MNKKTQMTTEELLIKLPAFIGRNWIVNEKGERIGYSSDIEPDLGGSAIGGLYLHNDGKDWLASYGVEGEFVCMNPKSPDEHGFYNNAFAYGSTPREALQGLYDWCVKNGFINKK